MLNQQQWKITVIGAGNMATCLVSGWLAQGLDPSYITMSDPNKMAREKVRQRWPINLTANNNAALLHADVIVLAVKPQVIHAIIRELNAELASLAKPLVISIAAGITTDQIQQWLGQALPIVRCMPNTPAQVQQAASGLYANQQVSKLQKEFTSKLMETIGTTVWVPEEEQIDIITALSGSGPAYFLLFMEALKEAAIELGLEQQLAAQLTTQTAYGTACMVKQLNIEPQKLRHQVTSPGGTTECAITHLTKAGFPALVRQAVNQAYKRAQTLRSTTL